MPHPELPLRRILHRDLRDLLALLDGLQQTLAGAAADVHAIDAGTVERFQQRLEGLRHELLIGIERRHHSRQDPMQSSRLAHFFFPCSQDISKRANAMRSYGPRSPNSYSKPTTPPRNIASEEYADGPW